MAHADFVHLRVHSAYSLSEGALRLKELIALCQRHAMPAVAVTDTGNLFGSLEFALAASEAGIQPITGTVLGLVRAGQARNGRPLPPDRVVLLAKDDTGYENLMALVSKAFLETPVGEEPRVDLADLESRGAGLICLTGGPGGPVGRCLIDQQPEAAEAALLDLMAIFGDRLYMEIMRHGMAEERQTETAMLDLAYTHGVPLVATNDCFFADADMYEAHDALLCIAEGSYVSQNERRRVTPHHRFKSPDEMTALFRDLPEAIANTVVIARRCAVMPEKRKPILPAFPTVAGRTEAEELRAQSEAGLRKRLADHVVTDTMSEAERAAKEKRYFDQLDYELGVITEMGFPGYFLIVADFIQWAKGEGIPVGPGRGSGAASVVAWSLTITDLDPIRFGLVFERFLNPERVSMPDFDIDFCQDRRDEVIAYVQGKYGSDKVAQIITFGKLQARAVLRDVGRVLQMPYGQVDRICKLVPNNPANPVTLSQAIEGEPQLRQMRDEDETVRHLIDIALKLEGLYRHASTHAAGVVIGDRRLDQLVPLYRDPRSPMPVTQFNMKYVEQAGLVKFDFLGLKTLTVLRQAVDLINGRDQGRPEPPLVLEQIPLDDAGTFDMLSSAATTGVFQLESSGMRDVLRNMRPTLFEDIIALVALYRPGPMDNIPTFIENKHGRSRPDYMHPKLEPILKETYGIMVYQEQVMQAAQLLAGYTLGGADLLRRAMGKKIKAEMDAQKAIFARGAAENGVDRSQAEQIFDQIEKFAGYGFNKAHAAAYAMVAYQTGYLKANYPVEFMAASMTLDMHNTDKLSIFKQELDRLKIRLLPPDVNASDAVFSVETIEIDGIPTRAIRYALGALKGVGVEAMNALVRIRREGGSFNDVFDMVSRLPAGVLNKRQMENLVKAGAFDSLWDNRAQLAQGMDTLVRHGQTQAAERESGQSSLFGGGGLSQADRPRLPVVDEWEPMEKLRQEFEAVGFYLSAHPIDNYPTRRVGIVASDQIGAQFRAGRTSIRLAGIVVGKREMVTKTGNRMAFVQLSDAAGLFEVTLFAETLVMARAFLETGTPVMATVDVQARDEEWRLTVQEISPLDEAVKQAGMALQVFVGDAAEIEHVRSVLDREGKGRGRVSFIVRHGPDSEVEIEPKERFAIGPGILKAIKSLPGIDDVRVI